MLWKNYVQNSNNFTTTVSVKNSFFHELFDVWDAEVGKGERCLSLEPVNSAVESV